MLKARDLALLHQIHDFLDSFVGHDVGMNHLDPIFCHNDLEELLGGGLVPHDGEDLIASLKGTEDSGNTNVSGRSDDENGLGRHFETVR
jgi:hypothetical protein